MNNPGKIIVITGAESTGKSTLTIQLAKHFNAPYITETARSYIENLKHNYTYDNVVEITKLHINRVEKLKNQNHQYIFVDTWLIIIKVWFEEVFHKTPDWLSQYFSTIKIDLFLLCETDLPWISDPVRENNGDKRKYLQNKYRQYLEQLNFNYALISGIGQERLNKAVQIIELLK